MEYSVLLKAGIRRHKGGLIGIFILVLLVSLSLGTVLTLWLNSGQYLSSELQRSGFGSLTAWVSGVPDLDVLTGEMTALPEVMRVERQELVYSNYRIGEQESDSEGQLIKLLPGETRYHFFTDDLSDYRTDTPLIASGEVYISPSMVSMFGVTLGDSITFPVARSGGEVSLTVKGFYEDPFMGSSMIGMKGFLICQEDYNAIVETVQSAGIDALARSGAMLHIFADSDLTTSALSGALNGGTSLPTHTEFVHSADAIGSFMLVLQNAFSGMLLAFVLVLLCAVLVVLGHSIGSTIEADYTNMGILKTVGLTSSALRRIQLLQYGLCMLLGMAVGLIFTVPMSRLVSAVTLTTTGIRIPANFPVAWCGIVFGGLALLLGAFIARKTAKIGRIAPMRAIRGEMGPVGATTKGLPAIRGTHMGLHLAGRQLLAGKRNYLGACAVALLLVFFVSLIGRMNVWLGPDGKGMMDAFNPADHDIGVQTFGALSVAEVEETVLRYTEITDRYLLAMPNVSVSDVDYTVNAISEPERFHILEGRTCTYDNEIVITQTIASDLNVAIGDTLTVTGDSGSADFVISGLYACANDMGANVGMSQAGYLKIGKDDPQIWCHHFFLADPTQKAAITETLEADYGGDVHIHENTWPGLLGIISAMGALVAFMSVMVVAFVLIVTVMTGSKLLSAEQRDIGIYKALGFTTGQLRRAFALRFGMIALLGAVLGTVLAAAVTDPLVSSVMKLAGISNFASHPSLIEITLPALAVVALFTGFAYLAAGKIRRTDLTVLIAD